MKIIKQYQSYDGKFFDDINECELYEWEIYKKVLAMLRQVKQICQNSDDCPNCPFYYCYVDGDQTPCKLVEVMTSNFDDMPWFETPDNWDIGEV